MDRAILAGSLRGVQHGMVWYSMHSHERWQHSRIDFTMTGAAMQLAEDGRGRSDGDVRHAHVC